MKRFYLVLVALPVITASANPLQLGSNFGFSRIAEGGVTSTVIPVELSAQYQWRRFYLGLDYGLTFSSVTTYYRDTRHAFRSGSAVATLQLGTESKQFELRSGIKVGLAPLTLQSGSLEDKVMTVYTYRSAGSAMGWQQPFLWLMNNYPALGAASIKTKNLPVVVEAEVAAGYLFSLNQQPGRFAFHMRLSISYDWYRLKPFLGLNQLRLSRSLENNDTNQTTAFVGMRYSLGSVSVSVTGNINIDLPYGIAGEGTRHFWGLAFGAAYQLMPY